MPWFTMNDNKTFFFDFFWLQVKYEMWHNVTRDHMTTCNVKGVALSVAPTDIITQLSSPDQLNFLASFS